MKKKEHSDCAAIWFAILERAVNLNDPERAAEAREKLKVLGYVVEVTTGAGGTQ